MTFPQPSSIAPVIGGQRSFRLTTPLASAGDLYESEVSALAFALGPDSDLAEIVVSYFDPNEPTSVSQATISPDRSFVGRIDAHNELVYPGGRKGRILIGIGDIYNPLFRPDNTVTGGFPAPFDPLADTVEFVTPILDVIQYFDNPDSLIPQRSDKTFRFQYLPIAPDPVDGVTWVAIPAYGRKSGAFSVSAAGTGTTVQVQIIGAKLAASGPAIPAGANQNQLAALAITGNDVLRYNYLASVDGIWDLFLVGLGGNPGGGSLPYGGQVIPIDITISDDAL